MGHCAEVSTYHHTINVMSIILQYSTIMFRVHGNGHFVEGGMMATIVDIIWRIICIERKAMSFNSSPTELIGCFNPLHCNFFMIILRTRPVTKARTLIHIQPYPIHICHSKEVSKLCVCVHACECVCVCVCVCACVCVCVRVFV